MKNLYDPTFIIFDNIKNSKSLLKPINIRKNDDIITLLNERATKLMNLLHHHYDMHDYINQFDATIEMKTNTDFTISAAAGKTHGAKRCLSILDRFNDREAIYEMDKEDFNAVLNTIRIPKQISFTSIILTQDILNYTNTFRLDIS